MMEVALAENKLLVVWQDSKDRLRHIIGELIKNNGYEFKYIEEKVQELKEKGFNSLTAFPEINKIYLSDNLFPAFALRLPDKRRSDISEVLKRYDLSSYDEFELLRKSGGKLPTDTLEFIEPIDLTNKDIIRQFYIAGIKYFKDNRESILSLKSKDVLSFKLEPTNSIDATAVQIFHLNKVVGYIPSYFSKEVTEAISSGRKIEISVVEVKPVVDENWHELIKVELQIS